MAPIERQTAKIPAVIYPGMFDGEYQVSINVPGHGTINLNVPSTYVEFESSVSAGGVSGFLRVEIVSHVDEAYVVGLPGDVEGAPSRITATRDLLQVA